MRTIREPVILNKQRKHFTAYNIKSYMFSTPTYSTLFLYPTGAISFVGALSVSISRQQAARILADARDYETFKCTVKRTSHERPRDIL